MWLKDKQGNWFVLQDILFAGTLNNTGTWTKSEEGDWFQEMETLEIKNLSLIA